MVFLLWLILEIFLTCYDIFYVYAIPTFQLGTKDWVQKKYCILYGLLMVVSVSYTHLDVYKRQCPGRGYHQFPL